MEVNFCESLSEFLYDDDGYNSDDMSELCRCRLSLDYAAIVSVFPSPPLSPCEEKLSNTIEMVWKCSDDESIARRLTEAVVYCGCQMCATANGPLIRDCMWSVGAPVPAATYCQDSSLTFIESQILDLETSGSLVKTEIVEAKSDALVDVPSVCARLAEYRQTGLVGLTTREKTPKSLKIVAARCNQEIPENYDSSPESGDDSSDEIDVVSVSPQKITSNNEQNPLVLPALASISDQIAALHNYSSPVIQLTLSCDSSPVAAYSVPPSPNDRLQKQKKIRRASISPLPMRKQAFTFRKYRQPRKMHIRNTCSNSEDSASSLLLSSDELPRVGGKRSMHNILERQRRSCLKLNFNSLRDVVPSNSGNCKMSKVAILKSAHSYMMRLIKEGQLLQAEMNRLQSLNQRWQRKLALLTV